MKSVSKYISEAIHAADKMLSAHIRNVVNGEHGPTQLNAYMTEITRCGKQWEASAKELAYWTDKIMDAESFLEEKQ